MSDQIELPDMEVIRNGLVSLLCSILIICVALIGIIFNVTIVRVFTNRSLISGINCLLAGLAIVDTALLISGTPLYASVALFTYLTTLSSDESSIDRLESAMAFMTVYIYPWTSIFQTLSIFIIVVITIERWIAVCFPLKARTACTPRKAILALVILSVISAFYNITRFWEYEIRYSIDQETNETGQVEVVPALRADRNYMHIYGHWMYFVFLFAVPFVVLVLLNAKVVTTIRRANRFRATLTRRQCKEHGTAIMMVVVAVVFLICNSLAFILNAMDVLGLNVFKSDQNYETDNSEAINQTEIDVPTPEALPIFTPLFYLLIDLSNLLILTHCGSHFFIFISFSKRFRNCVFTIFPFYHLRKRPPKSARRSSLFERDPLSGYSMQIRKRSYLLSDEDHHDLEIRTRNLITPVNDEINNVIF